MMRLIRTAPVLALLILTVFAGHVFPQQSQIEIAGIVTDDHGSPIPGASVLLMCDNAVLSGVSTGADGCFTLNSAVACHVSPLLKVSSIGYETAQVDLDPAAVISDSTPSLEIMLATRAVEISGVKVTPDVRDYGGEYVVNSETIQLKSRQMLIPTNLSGAIKQPQVARAGSSHSSQIRVNGTSPMYYLNGSPIGYDPDHYGMFTIIPAAAVDEISFQPQGTDVSFALPSVVELRTPSRFESYYRGDVTISATDATGMFSFGTGTFYAMGSVRKSVLDKLVDKLELHTERVTLPPTNFQDIFISAGVRLDDQHRMSLDHYSTRDFLSFNTADVGAGKVNTMERSDEEMTSIKLSALYETALIELSMSHRAGFEEYVASPDASEGDGSVRLNLSEYRRTETAGMKATFTLAQTEFMLGNQLRYVSKRDIDMSQKNWNFLPPFANSDNPHIYQMALNDTYDTYSRDDSELNGAAYFSVSRGIGPVEFESGVRADFFSDLAEHTSYTSRHSISISTGEKSALELFYGTFAENPVNNILEPYQVLVLASLNKLTPIKQTLVSAEYSSGPIKVGAFSKKMTGLPVVSPDFSSVMTKDGGFENGFITMESLGEAHFHGGTLEIEMNRLSSGRLDIYGSYAYTLAGKVDHGVEIPYELNAPHRFQISAGYKLSSRLTIGGEIHWRSGYPYTPSQIDVMADPDDVYSQEYYESTVSKENCERFPASGSLNLSGSYRMGGAELFCSVSNVTNRANPIINSRSGYIYDAGILPNIGVRWSF